MSFYDNFFNDSSSSRCSITVTGKKLVKYRNVFFIKEIKKLTGLDSPRLLEIGPGEGFFAYECRDAGIKYTGIEANKEMYKFLKKNGFEMYNYYVPPISLPKEKPYDVIFLNQVFEHMVGRNEAITLVNDLFDNLKTGGVLIISAPDVRFWKEDFFASDYTHNYPTSVMVLEQILSDNNFKILKKGVYSLFFNNESLVSFFVFIMRPLYALGLFKLFFRKRSYKVKTSILPSCYVIARKRVRS